MDRLLLMQVFEHVVGENGFAAGARKLGLSPAQVTRMVQKLEDHLGVQLPRRTTRRLALTAAGQMYLDRVREILLDVDDVDDAEEAANSHTSEMSGKIRLLSLPGMPTHLVAPAIAEFRRQHPRVTVELSFDAQASRDIEGHDITLLMGQVPLPGDAVVRHVIDSHSVLCASPDYIRRHGSPRTPQVLRNHAVVRFVLPGVASNVFKLVDEADGTREQVVDVRPVLTCNDHEAALRSTLEGAGISNQAMHVHRDHSGDRAGAHAGPGGDRVARATGGTGDAAGMSGNRVCVFLDHLLHHARQAKAGPDSPRASS